MAEISWEPPGPGLWELDRSHMGGGTTPIMQSVQCRALPSGMRRVFRELGTPADTLDVRFVNGFMYTRLRPLIRPDKPATSLPPVPLLKLVSRLHPEMRRREKTAARTLRGRPWRQVVAEWEMIGRSSVEQANLALQDVDVQALDDGALARHGRALIEHCTEMWELHFWLHGYDLGPIGLLLSAARRWGLDLQEVIELLSGASPSTSEPARVLAGIRASVDATGTTPATLDDVRRISPEVAADLDHYLRYRMARLFSRYDLDGVTLGEVPDTVLATIMISEVRDPSVTLAARTAHVRAAVPAADRAEFDERLGEARAAMNLRDDNGPTTAEWPLGLMRLGLLELGRRLVDRGLAERREHAFELHPEEVDPALFDGPPSSAELSERASNRRRLAALDPPQTLGVAEPVPPLDILPPALAEFTVAVQLVIEQLGMGGDRAEGGGLHGSGIGTASYRGIARRADSPEEALDAMEPGDVLVVPCTTPAYNMVLAIAGGVVTATGGPLSHAAVLSRELGIPAVIGATGALSMIGDGDEVELDPVAGEVRIITRA
ncbi:MAG TPA: PEP-utilizing enzyme [Ilumatobacteraceae bacterium]